MAAKIQDDGRESIKTSRKHTFSYTCLKLDRYVDQTMSNIKHILDVEKIQYGGWKSKYYIRDAWGIF